jgi:hypothetical protein
MTIEVPLSPLRTTATGEKGGCEDTQEAAESLEELTLRAIITATS